MSFLLLILLALAPSVAPSVAPAIDAIVAPAGGRVGFAAVDLASGRSLGLHESEAFPTQSVFKLPVAIEVLHQVDAGTLALDRVIALGPGDARDGAAGTIAVPSKRTIGELLEAMVIHSDNVACDKLLALLGGPGVVDARIKKLGVRDITIRFSELEMGTGKVDNSATPAAMVALLTKIARQETGLSPAGAKRLDDLLNRVSTGVKRLKGNLPPGTPVAHKTGTSQTGDGKTDATNDAGLITLPNGNRIAVVIFVHASPADEATRERTIAELARLAFDTFSVPPGKPATTPSIPDAPRPTAAPPVPVAAQPTATFEVHDLERPPFQTVRIWAPPARQKGPARKYEALLLLHGNRPPGSDKTYLVALGQQPQFRERILIVPGLPDGDHGWERPEIARALAALVDKIAATTPVDPKRLYLLGHSAGGSRVLPVARALSVPVAGIVSLAGDIGRPLRSHPPSLAAFARTPVLLICNSEDVGPNASCDLDRRNRELLAHQGIRDIQMHRLESAHAVDFAKLAPVLDEWIARSAPPSRGIREP